MPRVSNFPTYFAKFHAYFFRHRTIPSMQLCGEIIGVQSKSTVHAFYATLIEQGYMKKEDHEYLPTEKLGSIPLFASVKAGFPSPATDDLKDDMRLENYLIDNPANTIFVKVTGDSMRDASIVEGDVVIVEKGVRAHEGDIVVAVVDNEYTLKYLMKKHGQYCLEAANPDYETIYPGESLEIFGVVKGVFRKY